MASPSIVFWISDSSLPNMSCMNFITGKIHGVKENNADHASYIRFARGVIVKNGSQKLPDLKLAHFST